MNLRFIQLGLTCGLVAFSGAATTTLSANDGVDFEAPEPGSYALPIIKSAADGEVLNSKAEALRLDQFTQGKVTVMSFIYTRCAAVKACPMATGVLRELHGLSADDPTLANDLRLVSMSFDPGADTPKRMADYANLMRGENPGAEWHFLTTRSQAQLQPILAAYGQAVDRKADRSDPTGPLNHTLRVFLIDRAGNIRNIYSSGTLDVRLVLADIKTLLLEAASVSSAPITPAQAVLKPGETCTIAYKVETAARVTDITDKQNPQPFEVLLVDARNDDIHTTPTERAGVIVRIPESALNAFAAVNQDELARRFEGQNVRVTGEVAVEPHPLRHDATGNNQLRPVITITSPSQISIEKPMAQTHKL